MSRESVQSLLECAPGCRSRQHGLELNVAVMKGSSEQVKKYLSLCSSCHTARDKFGRTPLHMAASLGRSDLVDWMLNAAKLDPNVKDLESGWTALHRAAFYGELSAMRRLLGHPRVNAYGVDKEGCSPFDLLQRDLPQYVSYSTINEGDVYSWGDNVNFVHGTEAVKKSPELVEYFARQHISVKKVLFSKFHAVFLSSCGRVFACGHGLGGRLGTAEERTLVSIAPVPLAGQAAVEDVAVGDDHTLLLTQTGVLLSCGLNQFGQLGQSGVGADAAGRYSEPRAVKVRSSGAEEKVTCIAAAKFHSVVGTAIGVFTCGLNAGQLGHARGDRLQPRPRLVPGFSAANAPLMVAASVGASVVYAKTGDIFVLHRHECRKVARWADVRQVCVSGGSLDPAVHSSAGNSALTAGGGDPLVIAVLTGAKGHTDGTVALWQAAGGGLRRVRWSAPGRVVGPLHAALSPACLALVTGAGEAFQAPLSSLRTAADRDREEVVEASARRIPLVHRAVFVAVDRRAKNLAVLQAAPGTCVTKVPFVTPRAMREDVARMLDSGDLHDLVLKIGLLEVPCHKFVMAAASDVLEALFTRPDFLPPDFVRYQRGPAPNELALDCAGVSALVGRCLLEFCYLGTCNLLVSGFPVPGHAAPEASRERKKGKKKKETTGAPRPTSVIDGWSCDPIRCLAEVARRLNMRRLVAALAGVCVKDGAVAEVGAVSRATPPLTWIRDERSALCDAVLVSQEDGARFPAHRCLLAARMDFFRMMFAHAWQETSEVAPISLLLPGPALALILEFIYTDDCQSAQGDPDNTELLMNVLAAAEVYQCRRLKDLCEELLAARLTLRNVAEVVEVAGFYSAAQLTLACHDFMRVNVAALIEGRFLDALAEPLMDEFTAYYKQQLPPRRRPALDWPHPSESQLALVDRCVDLPADEAGVDGVLLCASTKRRRRRPHMQRLLSLSSDEGVETLASPVTPPWRLDEAEFPCVESAKEEKEEKEEPRPVSGRPRRPFKALSQKERRRLQREEPPPETSRKTPVCPWGPARSPAADVVSLRAVMRSQESTPASPATATPAPVPRPRRTSSSGSNPWGGPAAPSPAFAAIVREQACLDATAARLASRPFELIQTEERARQELMARVIAGLVPGEMNVRVEFVRGDAAPPVWRAKA